MKILWPSLPSRAQFEEQFRKLATQCGKLPAETDGTTAANPTDDLRIVNTLPRVDIQRTNDRNFGIQLDIPEWTGDLDPEVFLDWLACIENLFARQKRRK